MPTLKVIITSTRERRQGAAIARWFFARAQEQHKLAVELVDLAEVALPLVDEPEHPMKRQYHHEHTKKWSAIVAAADAFVFVMPEYNFGMPPAMLNALDFLYHEWCYKPAGFVSYGGVAGGTRSVQMAKLALTTLKVVPLTEAVTIPFFSQHMNGEGLFAPGDIFDKAISVMLDELARWTAALATLRA